MSTQVSNAGGLGFLTAITQPTPEALRAEIRKTRSLTSKPFGVNVRVLVRVHACTGVQKCACM